MMLQVLLGDTTILMVVHAALWLLVMIAPIANFLEKRSRPIVSAITRGEQSMSVLFTFYGITTVVLTLMIEVAETAKGYKSALVAADYIALTYLCFFNGCGQK